MEPIELAGQLMTVLDGIDNTTAHTAIDIAKLLISYKTCSAIDKKIAATLAEIEAQA